MKILFCSPCPLDRTLGAAQTLMALADVLEQRGWQCDLIDPPRLNADKHTYPAKLHTYLQAHAGDYDVVDFDYKRLDLQRRLLPAGTLFAARCQLLIHHRLRIRIPPMPTVPARLRALVLAPRDRRRLHARVRRATATLQAADLVIVLNDRDKEELGRHGLAVSKIQVVPNGITEERHRALAAVPVDPPEGAVVASIGMFGPRKGAADFPDLVRRVVAAVPEARFRLLGTRGRYQTAAAVLGCFPRALRSRVEVIPSFAPEALPGLLAPCAVGVFPSYLESFGLGVLEMLAAAMPVVAYDAPGPPAMLPPEYLAVPGDTAAMSRKVVRLLQDRETLADARRWARARAQAFRWRQSAQTLAEAYETMLARKRAVPQQSA